MCRTIMSAGHRRGAMMATMRCDHPDIEAFIEAKREAGRLRMFNLSVLVTDAFMTGAQGRRAVGAEVQRHDLSTVLRARELWDKIMRATYAYGRARRDLHRPHQPRGTTCTIARPSAPPIRAASSRCRPTAPACSARSTWPRWSRIRSAPKRNSTWPSWSGWCPSPSGMMDNVVDVSGFPLPQQTVEASAKRPHRARRHRARRCAHHVRARATARARPWR